jgi:LacI family transcriptional regulator
MMLGALEAILDMGFDCPGRISLAGIDDFVWGSAMRPRLTTVSQPIEEMGRRAVERLLERVGKKTENKRPAPKLIMLEPRFLIRDSCAPHTASAEIDEPTPAKRAKKRAKRR